MATNSARATALGRAALESPAPRLYANSVSFDLADGPEAAASARKLMRAVGTCGLAMYLVAFGLAIWWISSAGGVAL